MGKPYIGPIPAEAIDRRAHQYGDESEAFRRCIRRMDAAYLEIVRESGGSKHRVNTSRTFGPDLMTSGRDE